MDTLSKQDFRHKVILVPVNKCWDKPGLSHYDAVRYSWVVSLPKAQTAEYVLAIRGGEIKGVFEPDEWMEAKKRNFPDISDAHGNWKRQEWRPGHWRSGFRGREAPEEIQELYVGRHLCKELRGQGIRYAGM